MGKGKSSAKSQTRKTLQLDAQLMPVDTARLMRTRRPIVTGFAYWLWFIIPVLALGLSIGLYRRYVSLHADMGAFNSRRADKLARRRLKRARAALVKNNREDFYTELLKALWGYLGDKLNMPTSELLRDNIRQVLLRKGIPEQPIDDVIELIDEAEFAKYSSAGVSGGMDSAYQKAITVINNLEESFKNAASDEKK